MKNILISGMSGFIGGYLGRHLQNLGHNVKPLDRFNIKGTFNKESKGFGGVTQSKPIVYDVIIHCAANSKIAEGENPEKIWEDNVSLTHQILENCHNIPLFINMSSIAVYGEYEYQPSEYDKCNPLSNYGMSKLASEFLVNKYHKEDRVVGINLRLGGVCGPHMTHGILSKIIKSYRNNDHIIDFSKPAPGNEMSYIHVSYISNLILEIMNVNTFIQIENNTYNVCSKNTMNIEKIVEFFNTKLNKKMAVNWKDNYSYKNDNSIFIGVTDKVQPILDMPTIEQCLERTINECLL